VLICTLGTLILLLALVAQQAKETAVAQVEQERQDKLAAAAKTKSSAPAIDATDKPSPDQMTSKVAQRLIEQEQFRVNQLVSFRDQQTAELERKRDEISQVEAAVRKIKDQLAKLNREVETAMSADTNPAVDASTDEKTLLLMRDEAEKLRAEIKELEVSERGGKPRVVIVPHRGPNGTQRRPVYVLCTADGLQIMPEGSKITKAEAIAATQVDSPLTNPLGAALGAARLHAMKSYGDQLPPYPLLIVRPDGIYMYRVASALMKDWDDQYGYELVPGEVDLAFPGGDNVLRHDMDLAIFTATSRNQGIAQAGRGGSGRGNGGGGSDGSGFGTAATNAAYENDGQSPVATGPSSADVTGSNQAGTEGRQDVRSGGGSSQLARPLPTLSARDLDRQAQSNGFSMARDQRFQNPGGMFAESPSSQNGSYGAAGTVQSQSDALNAFLAGKTPPGMDDPSGEGGEFGDSTLGGSGENQNGPEGQADVAGGTSASGTAATAPASLGMPSPTGQDPNLPQQMTSGANSASRSNPIVMALTDSGQAGSAAEMLQSGSPGSQSENASASTTPQPPQVAQKMVRREGKNWALPDSMRGIGGTEFVRPISMRCHHDRYELIEQGRVVQTFPFGSSGAYQPTLQLATAIRDRVQTWGATMQGGYWRPTLEVSVGPHAEQRFHELQSLMKDSGVDITRRSP
jgi:hypothetical protein